MRDQIDPPILKQELLGFAACFAQNNPPLLSKPNRRLLSTPTARERDAHAVRCAHHARLPCVFATRDCSCVPPTAFGTSNISLTKVLRERERERERKRERKRQRRGKREREGDGEGEGEGESEHATNGHVPAHQGSAPCCIT